MKRMSVYLFILFGALALCCWLVRRHQRSASTAERPMDRLQENVRIDRGGAYTGDEAARRRLLEKLQQEERKQRPQEGRN